MPPTVRGVASRAGGEKGSPGLELNETRRAPLEVTVPAVEEVSRSPPPVIKLFRFMDEERAGDGWFEKRAKGSVVSEWLMM